MTSLNPSLVYLTNELWASRVTGIPHVNSNEGPDLMNDFVFVEVKSGKNKGNWTLVGEKQLNYSKKYIQEGFILLVLYELTRNPKLLKTVNLNNLERCVNQRTAHLLPFELVSSLQVSVGKEDCYAYPDKLIMSVPRISSYQVEKGSLHVYRGVNLELFKIEGKKL